MKYKNQNQFLLTNLVPILVISLTIISLNTRFFLNLSSVQKIEIINQEGWFLNANCGGCPKSLIFIDDSDPLIATRTFFIKGFIGQPPNSFLLTFL